jgi:hypothetical protein
MNKTIVLVVLMALMVGCGHTQVRRTLNNDAMLRVIIDPNVPVEHYVQIRRALVQSGRFEVIDRRDGWNAAVQEQDLQFRSGYKDRFSDREKWAHIGRMYGARGIITASAMCYQKQSWLGEYRKYCKQELSFIDSYTGRVEFAVSGENSEAWVVGYSVPDWNEVVEAAAKEYPKFFVPRVVDPLLEQYQDQSEELSKREDAKAQPRQPADTQGDVQALADRINAQHQENSKALKADLETMKNAAVEMNKDETDEK